MKLMRAVIYGVFLLVLCSTGCVKWLEHAYAIRIQNNANDTIQFYASYIYPDTTITSEKPRIIRAYPSRYSYWSSKEKFESILSSDTLSIYILSKDIIDKYNWAQIKSGYKILKRYDLSLGNLESLGWEIAFHQLKL